MSEDGELMLAILFFFAEEESKNISKNTKLAIKKKLQRREVDSCYIRDKYAKRCLWYPKSGSFHS